MITTGARGYRWHCLVLLVFFLGSLFLGWYSQSLPSGPTASAVQEVHAVNSDVITGAGGETANGTEPPAQGPDSKGNGTASEEEPLRIGVLVAWWPPEWWDKKPEEEKQLIMDNRECYCRMHGYDLFIGNDTQVSDGYWAKLMHTKRLLPKVDWLFFADVDFYITQLDRPLTDYIPPEGYHLAVPGEYINDRRFSNFNFLIKNSKEGREFLDIWLEEMVSGCNPKWPDQVAMWRSILRFLDPYTGSRTDCSRGPRHCCRDWCDAAQYASYSQATCFSETIGVMGCNADPNRCPPVFFTHPHSGLGLQAVGINEWAQVSSSMITNSFGIHCKPHYLLCKAYAEVFKIYANGSCSADIESVRPPPSPAPSSPAPSSLA